DAVSLIGGTATFDTRNVGTDKVVTLAGATLSGADAGNYNLTSVATALADINPRSVTASIIGNPTKVYDNTTAATLTAANFSLSGLVAGEGFTVTETAGLYNS